MSSQRKSAVRYTPVERLAMRMAYFNIGNIETTATIFGCQRNAVHTATTALGLKHHQNDEKVDVPSILIMMKQFEKEIGAEIDSNTWEFFVRKANEHMNILIRRAIEQKKCEKLASGLIEKYGSMHEPGRRLDTVASLAPSMT